MHTQVASDEHAHMHCNLHRLLDVLKPSLDSAVKFGDGLILEEEGARIVDRQAQLAGFDLRYTPRSLRSWDSLASAPQCSSGAPCAVFSWGSRGRDMSTCHGCSLLNFTSHSIMHVSSVLYMWHHAGAL